jgi:hypothetical protein
MRVLRGAILIALIALLGSQRAQAQGRPLVLPGGVFELDLGLGLGHLDAPDATGLGLNLELGYGFGSGVELRFRTGLRLGNDGRITQADEYGRMFETETFGTGIDEVANPEIGLRWLLARGSAAGLALDTRLYLPVEDGTELGVLLGLPVHFYLGNSARIATGVNAVLLFYDDTYTIISIPLHLWFRLSGATSLGLLTGVRFPENRDEEVPLGVGLATALTGSTDLRFWLLFPDVTGNRSARNLGAGIGLAFLF